MPGEKKDLSSKENERLKIKGKSYQGTKAKFETNENTGLNLEKCIEKYQK